MAYELKHSTNRTIDKGIFYPLGATLLENGVNFALYSQNANEVFLLLFDRVDGEPTDIIRIQDRTRFVWHCFVDGLADGQLYAFKVRGPYEPSRGLRFNEHKLLLDPYARAVTGKCFNQNNLLLAYDTLSPSHDLTMDTRDNTAIVPKCIVMDDRFDWQEDAPPNIPLEEGIIYEVHLKGFTAHSSSRVQKPGTYLGFIEKIPYLRELGITVVEFLPVHEFYVDDFLLQRGKTNYWGYNTIGFFAPESSYGTGSYAGCQVKEFKTLVRELHKAGIEVILDVVYNHSGEGNELGPTISFKGIDNPSYYALTGPPDQPFRYYVNLTGCGNTVNLADPPVNRFVMDSLRYWVEIMHVDGFRFDLASVLGREHGPFERTAAFFDTVSQDPVLHKVKLIAEPWDLGAYEVGNFPIDWSEWNGRFRDTVRRFVKGDRGSVADLGWRLTGSNDLYGDDGRSAYNSINFIACHDGLTLRDLISYNGKHNEANGENNNDGTNDNNSWNCGIEGDTDDEGIVRLRKQQIKNFACCLLFAAGTPMILGGDEIMRTQMGNNNAYCQDNEVSWFNWDCVSKHADILQFFRKAIALTQKYTILQRRKFLLGENHSADRIPDIDWFGKNLDAPAWNDPELCTLCYRLDGAEENSKEGDYWLFVILNADYREQWIRMPPPKQGMTWYRLVDTTLPSGEDIVEPSLKNRLAPADSYLANPRSTVLLLAQ
jgi:isoamylase